MSIENCACCSNEFTPPVGEDSIRDVNQEYCTPCAVNRCDTEQGSYVCEIISERIRAKFPDAIPDPDLCGFIVGSAQTGKSQHHLDRLIKKLGEDDT